MDQDFVDELQMAARKEQRTLRQFIRHVLRTDLAKRGYLDYHNVPAALVPARDTK